MPLVISDETLAQMKLDEREARIEIACRLFDAGKLQLWPAAQLAGLSRIEFEDQLKQRGLAIYRIDEVYWRQELKAIDRLEQAS
jgi:predicted HTH domain antitoxin